MPAAGATHHHGIASGARQAYAAGMSSSLDPSPGRPRRSLLVTLLAWFIMICSGLLIPMSFISLLMIISGGYGTQNTEPLGFFIIIVAPTLTMTAGLGLLLRWRWARYYMFVLFAVLIAVNVKSLASGGKSTTIHTTASGVVTTSENVWGGPNYHSVPIIAFCTAAIVLLWLPSVRREFRPVRKAPHAPAHATAPSPEPAPPPLPGRDWRVGHRGRDMMYYEEFRDGAWQRLNIDGEMLTGREHHVIYLAGPDVWSGYPDWARHRRPEIIARIKSEFRAPDYEYHGEDTTGGIAPPPAGTAPTTTPPNPVPAPPVAAAPTPRVHEGKWWAVPVTVVCLFACSLWMGWLVKDGIDRGVARDVFKQRVSRTQPVRAEEPARFWFLVGTYAFASAGSGAFGIWVLVVSMRRSARRTGGKP